MAEAPGAAGPASGPATVEEHLATVLAAVGPLEARPTALDDALGLVLVADQVSPLALPRFDNSAMDGYAVRAGDLGSPSSAEPVELPVAGEIGAGQATVREVPAGSVVKIMTGAPVPPGADAVVPYEWTDRGASRVRIDRAPEPGAHVRSAGEDVATGDLLVEAGTRLGPRDLGLLASVGIAEVPARPRPVVAVISTGAELREPGAALADDSIYDGNSYLLAGAVATAGAIARRVGIVGDDPATFLQVLRDLVAEGTVDAVVTSGGVSQGDFDVVKAALRPLGTVWFGPVAMQPGKPQGFGHVDGVPVFCLPGNPVSSFISFELFVRPALRTMAGRAPVSHALVEARLTEGVGSPPGRRQFLRGRVTPEGAGLRVDLAVSPVGGSGSHLVGDLAAADALIVVPEDVEEIAPGARVQVLRLTRPEDGS